MLFSPRLYTKASFFLIFVSNLNNLTKAFDPAVLDHSCWVSGSTRDDCFGPWVSPITVVAVPTFRVSCLIGSQVPHIIRILGLGSWADFRIPGPTHEMGSRSWVSGPTKRLRSQVSLFRYVIVWQLFLTTLPKTMLWKYFQNFMFSFKEKWKL